jgi:hypothetical protein
MQSRSAKTDLTRSLGAAVDQVQAIGRATGKLVGAATDAQGGALRQAMRAVGIKALPMPSLSNASACGLPRCDCPPADLGEIRKVVDRAEEVRIAFRVHNTTRARRLFRLNARPIASPSGQAGGAITVTPAQVDLDPGEFQTVQVQVDARQHKSGADYRSVIDIASERCETMHLGVSVEVADEDDAPTIDLHCCCEPRVRPLRWYHHYYCDPRPAGHDDHTQASDAVSHKAAQPPGASAAAGTSDAQGKA